MLIRLTWIFFVTAPMLSAEIQTGGGMDAAEELGPGVQIAGRYQIDELIGRGGMGTIWLATDEILDRRVAIKCVRVESQDAAGRRLMRERMLREARIAARLHHQNIVTIFDVIERDDPVLVLEYVPARSLAEIIDERGELAPDEVADIGVQVAAALATAHHAGVVHRDIKPGNILVAQPLGTGCPLVKLTDFGISHAADTPTLTATGLLTGTPAYFAPETARGEGTDARSDVYSLGATLYTALEGRPPFGADADNLLALLARVGRGGAPPPQHPGPLADLLGRLMHDDPRTRPTAARAEHELSQIASPPPAPSEPPGPGTAGESGNTVANRPNPAPTTRRLVPWRRILVAGCVAAALIASGVAVATSGPTDTPPTPAALPPPERIAIGNPQTADPCSLIDLPTLSRYGNAQFRQDDANFSGCRAIIRDRVQFYLEFLSPEEVRRFNAAGLYPMTGGVTQARGPLTIARHEAGNDHCVRIVRLPDEHVVQISAVAGAEAGAGDVCDIAESGTTAAVDILLGSGVGVRAPLIEERALARADACSLLPMAELQAVLGLTDIVTRPGFGNWRCTWDDAVGRKTAVRIFFSRTEPLQESASAPAATFNGLPGNLTFSPEGGCIAHIAHSTRDASRYIDYAYVQTLGPQPPAELCEKSRALANAVAARLPPPN